MTTPHLDIQSTTDLKLDKQEIKFDVMKNTRGIVHDLTIVEWGNGDYGTWSHGATPYSFWQI